jgi:serine/threonine-protein kinase RIO1
VIIDLPQAVNAAGNNSAATLFARDVNNLGRFFGRFEPAILRLQYAKEIWALYEKGKLTPEVELTGVFVEPKKSVDVGGVLRVIEDAQKERDFRVAKKVEREAERRAEKAGKNDQPIDGMLHRIDEPNVQGGGRFQKPSHASPARPVKDPVEQWGRRSSQGSRRR